MGRGDALARALRLLRELLSGPASVVELGERLGWTARTVRRDLAALREAGIAVEEIRDWREVRYRLDLDDLLAALAGDRERLREGRGRIVRATMEAADPTPPPPAAHPPRAD
jgi:DNA-binding transcriptional ArsR family regulator